MRSSAPAPQPRAQGAGVFLAPHVKKLVDEVALLHHIGTFSSSHSARMGSNVEGIARFDGDGDHLKGL